MTPVHASRMWSELIAEGSISYERPFVTIEDKSATGGHIEFRQSVARSGPQLVARETNVVSAVIAIAAVPVQIAQRTAQGVRRRGPVNTAMPGLGAAGQD